MKFIDLVKKRHVLSLIAALSVIAVSAVVATIFVLYNTAFEQQRKLLSENLETHVRAFAAEIRLEKRRPHAPVSAHLHDSLFDDNIIGAIESLQRQFTRQADSYRKSEYIIAKRDGENIVFLHSNQPPREPAALQRLAIDSERARLMKLALLGESGTVSGLDHTGNRVLAAYRYLPEYKLGIVAKIDLAELFSPYLKAILITSMIAIVFIIIGAYSFTRAISPIYSRIEQTSRSLRRQHAIISRLREHASTDPCDIPGIFNSITEAASHGLDVHRTSIWLFNEDHTELECADLYSASNHSHDSGMLLKSEDHPDYFSTIATDRIFDVSNVYFDNRMLDFIDDYMRPYDIHALLGAPVSLSGKLIGVVCNEYTGMERQWTLEDKNFARSIADNVALAIGNCERNRAEQALKTSEERYQLAVEGSNDGLWDWEIDSDRMYQSKRLKELLGYGGDDPDFSRKDCQALLHPDDADAVLKALDTHLEHAEPPYDVECRLRTRSGEYRWYRVRGRAVRDESGKPYRMSGSISDISEIKSVQEDLSRFKATLDETTDSIYMFAPHTLKFFYANRSACNAVGYTSDELENMTPLDIKPEFDETRFRSMLEPLIARPGQSLGFETVHMHKDDSRFPVEIHLQYIVPADESPRFVASVRDISKRKQSEAENAIQRALLEQIHTVQNNYISGMQTDEVFNQLLDGFLDITESEYGFIGEIEYPGNLRPYMRIQHITDVAWNEETRKLYDQRLDTGLIFSNLDTLYGAVITGAELVISNDPANDARAGGMPKGHPPLHSFMGIPLKRGSHLIGMVGVANRAAGYDYEVTKFLEPLISTCTSLIEASKTEAQRYSMENALRSSEKRVKTVLDTVVDGIITIDESGTIESFNRAAENIFGYSASEVIGNNVKMLMPAPYFSNHDVYLQHYREAGELTAIGCGREVDGLRKDGTVFPLDLAVNEMQIDGQRKFTGVARDISVQKKAEEELIAARDDAEKANRSKSEFLSSISHELRTPLNAIMGFAQLLKLEQDTTQAQRKHASQIYDAGSHLLNLINDVLDLAKIESGRIDLSIDSIRLADILGQCIKLVRPHADERNINLSYINDDSDHCNCANIWIRADNTRLKQILLNLLSNAVKYNRDYGSVSVCCPAIELEGYHRICITDTGSGIPESSMHMLFQPFNRLGAECSDIEGTGIGLVITRHLVEMMHGYISLESKPGKGTSFFIDMPAAEPVSTVAADNESSMPALDNNKKGAIRVLVAEDNLTNQELMSMQLDMLGYISDVATNGNEAWQMLQRRHYDLLLTDIHMPEMDGYRLSRAIRNSGNERLNAIIIIAITANAEKDEEMRCLASGMNDYLSKPVDVNKLNEVLSKWMRMPATATEPNTANEFDISPRAPQHEESPVDMSALIRYVGSDISKHRHFFRLFLDTAPETIHAIHKGYEDRNAEDITNCCHKLKSSARAIGAIELSMLCQLVEAASVDAEWETIESALPMVDQEMSLVESCMQAYLSDTEIITDNNVDIDDVLIIDDDLFVLDLVSTQLNGIGVNRVDTMLSCKQALASISDGSVLPSVILLDLNMPEMDGVEFLRHLSELSYSGDIILISGEDERVLHSAENLARARRLNILGTIEKPVTSASLLTILKLAGTKNRHEYSHDASTCSEDELKHAIEHEQLLVYYQPQVDIQTGALSAVEALVRWLHPQRGMIPPNVFIPAAEEFGLINKLTDIVMNRAMQQCASWKQQGIDINLALNISVDTLDRLDLPETIVECAGRCQLDISKVVLEITESRLMQDITSALDILTRLSIKGLGLSIDDFGTGYSSMEQLQRIPFRELKIDRAFVNGAANNKATKAILESSVALAHKLNMTIVAEGVENAEDWNLVSSLGCNFAQGYYMAKPMPGEDLPDWLDDWNRRHAAEIIQGS